jgi:predicted TIM-barrel fold metal-dependent hydrolase
MRFAIIDAHAHCGKQDAHPTQAFEDYYTEVNGSDILGVVMFPPVGEIYDRYDPAFEDTSEWQERRQKANRYLLSLEGWGLAVFPFFFIWNDFAVAQLTDGHRGIKWHRHAGEPRYHYEDPKCKAAIEEIRRRNLPICLEEEWDHTLHFINELALDIRIIIPHCGLLNGGFEKFCRAGLWERENVFTDTALAPSSVIAEYVRSYGHTRIMYGSDFPFGDPVREYQKILKLELPEIEKEAILMGNVQALLADVKLAPKLSSFPMHECEKSTLRFG